MSTSEPGGSSAGGGRRILLSGPDVGSEERAALLRAFDGGWIAPAGPELAGFEGDLASYVGTEACVALASGTAALHLALLDVGIGLSGGVPTEPTDRTVPVVEVVVPSATFAASAFSVVHAGARPVFCDVDAETWCLSPTLLDDLLANRAAEGRLPGAVMSVDLYGSCPDYDRLLDVCGRYEVPLVEDAAEGLGSVTGGRMAGSFGRSGALSFNGNKLITTSGGGALLGPRDTVDRARYLATQARSPVLHYEHEVVGYNYRMSNLLAAMGRAQLASIEPKLARRAATNQRYRSHPDLAGLRWCPYGATERPNHWLSVALLPTGVAPAAVCKRLDEVGIEARPAWKPMHRQPVFAGVEMIGGEVSDDIYARGICLPSGSGLSDEDIDRVIDALAAFIADEA